MSKPYNVKVDLRRGESSAKLVSRFITKCKNHGPNYDENLVRELSEKSSMTRRHRKKSLAKRYKRKKAEARRRKESKRNR